MISGCLNISLYLCPIYTAADTALGPGGVKGRPDDAFFRCALGKDVQTGPWLLPCSVGDTPKISRGQMPFLRFSFKAACGTHIIWLRSEFAFNRFCLAFCSFRKLDFSCDCKMRICFQFFWPFQNNPNLLILH